MASGDGGQRDAGTRGTGRGITLAGLREEGGLWLVRERIELPIFKRIWGVAKCAE